MSEIRENVRYTKTHEWVRDDGEGLVTVGISDHAQHLLGDMVFIELPEIDSSVAAESECGVVESVKAASDIYAPLNGTVVAINDKVIDAPETVNNSPYDDGWLFQLMLDDESELKSLLDSNSYSEIVAEDDH